MFIFGIIYLKICIYSFTLMWKLAFKQ